MLRSSFNVTKHSVFQNRTRLQWLVNGCDRLLRACGSIAQLISNRLRLVCDSMCRSQSRQLNLATVKYACSINDATYSVSTAQYRFRLWHVTFTNKTPTASWCGVQKIIGGEPLQYIVRVRVGRGCRAAFNNTE